MSSATSELFEKEIHYPSPEAKVAYESLVGLDVVKARLTKEVLVLTQPQQVRDWCKAHHGRPQIAAIQTIRRGSPLFIFAGDVGTGKTVLAESFGDDVARTLKQPAILLRMSIQARGSGLVGDMTRQINRAFRTVEARARKGVVTILLLDEADALAESRETQQMHHEDRAGVNALIQGIDHLRGSELPVVVVFCSNRGDRIDPAIRRRAVHIVEFRRPDDTQRRAVLDALLGDLEFTDTQMKTLVRLTGPRDGQEYGYTYSDIADRLVRGAIFAGFPDAPLDFQTVKRVAEETNPTRPFGSEG